MCIPCTVLHVLYCLILCPDYTVTLQTLELARIAEEEEEEAARKPSTTGSRTVEEAPQQCWDCESVLSLRSNLDNHPGTISEQSNRRYRPASGKIKLAAKTGEHWSQHRQTCLCGEPSSARQQTSVVNVAGTSRGVLPACPSAKLLTCLIDSIADTTLSVGCKATIDSLEWSDLPVQCVDFAG